MQLILITIKDKSIEKYIIKGKVEQTNCKQKYEPPNIKPYLLIKHASVKKNIIEKKNKERDNPTSQSLSLLIFFYSESSFSLLF